jgi:AcrR family transcriptional regulator
MSRSDLAMPVTKQARSELSTARLLDAAGELITERGYERMTLAAIGKHAGYSHGLVTRRFGSKEGLLWALVERMVVDWKNDFLLPAVGDAGGIDALRIHIEALRGSWRHSPQHMRALYSLMFEALLPVPILRERMTDLHKTIRLDIQEAVQRGIDRGSVDPSVDSAMVARLFVSALRGSVYQWLLDPEYVDIDVATSELHVLAERLLPEPRSTPEASHG